MMPRTRAWFSLSHLIGCAVVAAGCGHQPWQEPGPDWKRVTSEHFVVHTDADVDELSAVVARLEDAHEALAVTFFDGVPIERVEVLLPARERVYRRLAPPDTSGFFAHGSGALARGLLVFPASIDRDAQILDSVAAHELAHRFLHALHPDLPGWFHEGFAMYVGGLTVSDGSAVFDTDSIHEGFVFFSEVVPLAQLFAAPDADFHGAEKRALYMSAWYLMRELLNTESGQPKDRFRALAARLADARTPDAQAVAVAQAFGAVPLATVEERIREAHAATYRGYGKARERRTLAARLSGAQRPPLRTEPDDPAQVRALCVPLHERYGG